MIDIEKAKLDIGKRVKLIRNKMNLTQKDFSKLIGMKTQYLSNVEKGQNGLTVEKIIEICNVTGVSSDYLILGIDNFYNNNLKKTFSKYSKDDINKAFEIFKDISKII